MRKSRIKIRGKEGFTLLELLIVIAILVVLAGVALLVLNPAETLKRSRDAQRISDLTTLKSAVSLYLTATTSSTIYLAGAASNDGCKDSTSYGSGDKIYYSYPSSSPGASITDSTLDGGSASVPASVQAANTDLRKVDATGWLPVQLSGIRGGSPVSSLPVDPTNTIASVASVVYTDLVYRYACDASDTTFEFNANLESSTYTTSPDNREADDGGNESTLYEIGTKLTIMGGGQSAGSQH